MTRWTRPEDRTRKDLFGGALAPAAVSFDDYELLAGVSARRRYCSCADASPLCSRWVGKPSPRRHHAFCTVQYKGRQEASSAFLYRPI